MRKFITDLALVIALAVGAGISGGYLLGGLLTGSIDGPARGNDAIERSDRPVAFWLMAGIYLATTAGLAATAYGVAKRAPAA